MRKIMIAGTNSGCGKTTITCAILMALINRGMKVCSFKSGPDYIDPMFHSKVLKIKSRNLDSYMLSEDILRYLFEKNSAGFDISVIEGAMGYYDGIGLKDEGSSYATARAVDAPVILTVNAKGMSQSVIATLLGYVNYKSDSRIKGVIFNNLSSKLYEGIKEKCDAMGIKALGCFPHVKNAVFSSRHLGLVMPDEIEDFYEKVKLLGEVAEENLDIDGILELAVEENSLHNTNKEDREYGLHKTRIALARDEAFCFYYEDNIDLLRELGCEIVEFSPIHDRALPENINGLIIGGGYPELYCKELSENEAMRTDIKDKIKAGLTTFAECGGFMYLHDVIRDKNNTSYRMVGAVPGECYFTEKLQHFGYVMLTATEDGIMCKKGESIKGHEFHRSISEAKQDLFISEKEGKEPWMSYVNQKNLIAGFPHIHFYSNIDFATNFVNHLIEGSKE